MKVNDFGVWEISIPPLPSGQCAIPHDSKIKVRVSYKGSKSFVLNNR